jgi:PQQ-dependent dehydrogenase (methanol/ethanol family)
MRSGGLRLWPVLAGLACLAVAAALAAGAAGGAATGTSDWPTFGGSLDSHRHSPLTEVTPSNVTQLGRVFRLDFAKLDPAIKKGQQGYPLVIGGVIYVTTADDEVFAVDGVTGAVKWRFKPGNSAVFKNFGIVANRGLAYCDGRLFLATLDLHLDALDPKTGKLLDQVAMSDAVPGATPAQGYSETSPGVCADHLLLIGASGSDYGVRGFFMAYHTNLEPAWPHPYWTVPPEREGWRRSGRLVGGGSDWTPATVDPTSGTVYFGTGAPAPLYAPALRGGSDPRTDSLIALDLRSGRQRWWRQQIGHDQWGYDTAQPPLVYTAKVGGHTRRVVSVATKEGVWFAYDAGTGQPLYERVKVIDQVEHPSLRPGQPVVIYPASLGGVNYSPASFDPDRSYVLNAAAETASVLVQERTPKSRQRGRLVKGDVFLGLSNGDFGQYLKGWHDHGSVSAIDVTTGRVVWKKNTPEPERGGVTTTAGGLSFVGDGDGVLRAFNTQDGALLWHFQTGHQIAAAPSVYAVNGKEYLALTVGGTPTSSNGGTASELQVFALGGNQTQSPPPGNLGGSPRLAAAGPRTIATAPTARVGTPARRAAPGGRRSVAVAVVGGAVAVQPWNADSQNEQVVKGTLRWRGKPVAGAGVEVGGYHLPGVTGAGGSFAYPADTSIPGRYVVRVVNVDHATAGGAPLSGAARQALRGIAGEIDVGYAVSGLSTRRGPHGVVVEGRIALGSGAPAPVSLYTYALSGRIVNAAGKPVFGAVVSTRTLDRQFWTLSDPSDSKGRYTSFFTASDQISTAPRVQFSVQIAHGQRSYAFPFGTNVLFSRLRSATMNIRLPAGAASVPSLPRPHSYSGAVYQGLRVGLAAGNRPVQPLAATWPDASGRFRLVIARRWLGKTLSFWESDHTVFAHGAPHGGAPVELSTWPVRLAADVPRGLGRVTLPR